MVRNQRVRTARAAGGQTVTRDGQQNTPCAKIIARLRPVLQDELVRGETQSALTTAHRGEVKLKIQTATKYISRTNTGEGFGDGKRQQEQQQQQQQREGLPTTVYQVDTVLGPGDDTSEVYAAAASRLVDRAITGGRALLLIAGTPGSGRSHTLWGIEEQGLLPLALADLSRRWSCGNGSPFYHSSSAAAPAAAATTGSRRSPSSSSTPAERHSPSPFAPPLVFRLCVAEVLPGDRETNTNKDEARTAMSTSQTARDLLRGGSSSVVSSRPSTGGGGSGGGGGNDRDVGEKKAATSSSPSPPRRWALSARDALVGLTSSSFSASPPTRSSFDRSGRRLSGGGARKSRAWMGMGRGRGGVAAEADRSLLTSRVLGGVDEVSAEGIEETLSLVREGLSKRRREGHLVISAKLVMARGNDARVAPTPEGITETGELVFIELGDCPDDGLPQTLRNALSYLKIGRDHQESLEPQTPPASRSTRVAITGITDALPIPKKQRSVINTTTTTNNNNNNNGPADNPPHNDPLRALLSAFADPGPRAAGTLALAADSPVKGAAATAATATAAAAAAVAVTGTAVGGSRLSSRLPGGGRGAAAAAVAAEGGVGAGAGRSASASAAASDGPLVVSVVATLRSGDACYREDKALLGALAKSSRVRPDSWRRLPLGRILASMPSFSWWSSHPGPASAAADGSAPAPAAATAPSAPPVPSSEEVSLAMSNYSSSRSASSSLSNAHGDEVSAATVTVGGGGGANAGLSAAAEDDGPFSPTSLKETPSVAAEADGMDNSSAGESVSGSSRGGGSSRPHGDAVPKHLEEASSKGDDDGAGVLATGGQDELPRRSQGGRRTGDGDGSGAGLLTIEGADEAADKDAAGGARVGQKDERRVSPPWDDSTLGLLGLTRDELIERVLQAEKQSRHWKAQHALVKRKMAALLAATESHKTGSKGGGSGVGPSRVSPMVGGATGSPGSISPRPAGRSPEHLTGCSPRERNHGEGNGALAAVSPCETSAGTSSDTTEAVNEAKCAQAREHHGGAEGEESGASCSDGKGEEKSQGTSLTPGSVVVDSSAPVKALPSSGGVSGGGVESMPVHDVIADHLRRSRIIAAADTGESTDIDDSSPPQPLTFKERRAVFSSNNSVPMPPAGASLPWSVVASTAAAGKTANPIPSSPRPSPPRAGTRTSPPFTAFSSSAVEAARQNLKRGKVLSKRGSTVATRSHDAAATPGLLSFQEREGDGDGDGDEEREGSCVSSDSRSPPHAAVSVSSVPLSQGTSSAAACSLSPPPCTPPRPLHHRRTSAPSPPAPSPCSTADRYRTTPGSPGSASSSASSSTSGARSGGKLSPSEEPSSSSPWSSSFSSPSPPSTASSPQLASPPSFPKPNAERRRARARSAESGEWTTASSLSMTSSVPQSPATAGTASALEASASEAAAAGVAGAVVAVAARLPPTAPSAAPRRSESMPASTAAATSASPAATLGSSASSCACWSGTALRQKPFRLQHSPASAYFKSTASSLPSPLPEESDTGAASAASRVAGKGEGTTGVHHEFGGGGGSGGSGGGKTTEEGFPSSKGFSAFPPGEVALSRTSFRSGGSGSGGGGSGGGVRLEDDWKERPAGVGPWPLFEETREGRASLHEKRGIVTGSGAIGTGAGSNGHLSGGGAEKAGKPAAAPATEEAADPEVSIGAISTMQASRLRTLREKMERRYWPRGAASETAATATATTAANHPLASNVDDASATIPKGPPEQPGAWGEAPGRPAGSHGATLEHQGRRKS